MIIELFFFVVGNIISQVIFFTQFSKEDKMWFGWTLSMQSIFIFFIFFENLLICWISWLGLVAGFLAIVYVIEEKFFLDENINKILYFHPKLPRIKLCKGGAK